MMTQWYNPRTVSREAVFSMIPDGLYEAKEDDMTTVGQPMEQLVAAAGGSEPKPLSVKDVAHLGAADMRTLIAKLRQCEASASERIGYAYSRHEEMKKLLEPDVQALVDLSVDVKNLQEPVFGSAPDSLWIGTYFQHAGHTTFRYCGQCEYASSWSSNGVTCRFDPKGLEGGVPYASPCTVVRWPKQVILKRLRALMKEVDAGKVRREIVRANIRFLLTKLPDAQTKPIDYRERLKHFTYGDRVRVYAYSNVFGKFQNTWIPATVVAGTDGHSKVRISCDEPLIGKRCERDEEVPAHWMRHSWGVYHKTPFILLEWEFMYFQDRPDEFERWLGNTWRWHLHDEASDTGYDPDRVTFLTATRDKRKHRASRTKSRLMSAEEAKKMLGFAEYPTDSIVVRDAYRARIRDGDEPTLRRAKDTLLTRIYGTRSIGG